MKIKKMIPISEKMVQVRVLKNPQGNLTYTESPVMGMALDGKGTPRYVVHSRTDDFGHPELHEGCELRCGVYEDVYLLDDWKKNSKAILGHLYAKYNRLAECQVRLKENPEAVFESFFDLFNQAATQQTPKSPTPKAKPKTATRKATEKFVDF